MPGTTFGAHAHFPPKAKRGQNAGNDIRAGRGVVATFSPSMAAHDQVISAVKSAIEEVQRAMQPDAPAREHRHRHRDRQLFDEVSIRTVPRFKTSILSGNEWRMNAGIEFKRKGQILYTEHAGNAAHAASRLTEITRTSEFQEAVQKLDVSALCDQEGCSEPWTRKYKLKKTYCHGCAKPSEFYEQERTRSVDVACFCDRHSDRGDASYEDSNDNYEMDDAMPVPPRPEDKSQAALIIV